ncbi:MAG: cyclic pyranopterin monophosphate synthase MoaC [Bacteroidota bacterium]
MPFTHLDADGKPQMVDVGDKAITTRVAVAEATVVLGEAILAELTERDFNSKKGSIIQTAVLAGTMAVKNTWATIPLCHAIPISGCSVDIVGTDTSTGSAGSVGDRPEHRGAMKVVCKVRTEGRTGVEMEALHGATVAALTIYDMCKSMSHGIRIENVHLVSKTGGKSDYGVG